MAHALTVLLPSAEIDNYKLKAETIEEIFTRFQILRDALRPHKWKT